jgi:hypothetical protein
MTGFGLVERQRGLFANALRPLKGGTSGTAEIRRGANGWLASTPPETVAVHYERVDSKDGSALDIALGGQPGYTVHFAGLLDTPLKDGDRILIAARNLTLKVERKSLPGNLSPTDSVDCVVL